MQWTEINREVLAEFRANGGRVARFGGLPVIILHTVRRVSGQRREVPLVLIEDPGDLLVFATAAGAKKDPQWVADLEAQPRIDVELAAGTQRATLRRWSPEAARPRIARQADGSEMFADYVRSAAPREIPIFSVELHTG